MTFSVPLAPATASNVNNYTLVHVGPYGWTGPHPRSIPITSLVYNPAAGTVTIVPSQRLNLHDFYRLTVRGTGPGAVQSLDGLPLDGTGNGKPGSDFVAVIHGFGPFTYPADLPGDRSSTTDAGR